MKSKEIRIVIIFFVLAFVIRLLFILVSGLHGYDFVPVDSREYVALAKNVLNGDFGMDIGRFVRSPLYPIFIALHMKLAGAYWGQALTFSQVVLSALCTVYIFKTANVLFGNITIAILAGALSLVYVPTFYFTSSYTTEALYQFLYLSATYYFILFLKDERIKNVIVFSVLFALCYLNRSEIGLYFPFMVLVIFYQFRKKLKPAIIATVIFGAVGFLFTLPWGLYNLNKYHEYITSSNGGKFSFYLSNSNISYIDLVETPKYGTKEFKAFMNDLSFAAGPEFDSMAALPVNVKQDAFFKNSIAWVKANPEKTVKIKAMSLVRFMLPGVSWKHHPLKKFLITFLLGLPVYLFFYLGLYWAVKKDPEKHLWFVGKFISTLLFLAFFVFTERYRAYGIEPYYLVYAAFAVYTLCPSIERLIPKQLTTD